MSVFSYLGQRFGLFGKAARSFWATFNPPSYTGESVTLDKAMGVMSFWRGVLLTGSTLGTLPQNVFRLDGDATDGVLDRKNEYDQVARISPNEDQTPAEFWEGVACAVVATGNSISLKLFVGERLVGLEPLIPDPAVTYPWRDSNRQLFYNGRDFKGNEFKNLRPDQVFHVKGPGFGGDSGLSAVSYGANALGMSIAANKVAGKTFASGLSASGFLETGQVLNEPDRKRLEEIMAAYQGNDTVGKMMILEGGMKFNKLSLSAVDAQLLLTMGFNIEEVARLLGMPPILLGHTANGQTMWGTGVESIIQAWYTLGLRALITRIEKAFNKRVVKPADRGRFYLKLSVAGLLRGDTETQARIAASLVQNGLSNRDDQRALLWDAPPIPDGSGKIYTAQTNLAPLDMLGKAAQGAAPSAEQALRNIVETILAEREDSQRRMIDERLARSRPN